MRTTLDLPDGLLRQVKAKAALEGVTLKELLTHYVASGLQRASPVAAIRQPSRLPVIKRRGSGVIPSLSAELQAQLEQEEDLAKLSRSFGR